MQSEPTSRWRTVRQTLRRAWATRFGRARRETADYRDRISVATWPLILGLALSLFVALPTFEFSFIAFGSPATLPLTGTLLVSLALAMLAAAGAESVVAVHPHFAARSPRALRARSGTWPYWALPMAMTIIITLILPRMPTPLIQVLALLLTAMLFILVFFALYLSVEPGQQGFRRSRLVLNVLTYGAAVALFLFVYQTRARSLVSATLVTITATLLAVELLRSSTTQTGTVMSYGAIVGLILGQVTWALNYWPLPNLSAGLLLLLIFYVLVSLAQNGLQGRLTGRVVVEFLVVTVAALILIGLFGPGFSLIAESAGQ